MITLERTSYTYNDKCSKKRLQLTKKKLGGKSSDEKVKEIFSRIGLKV